MAQSNDAHSHGYDPYSGIPSGDVGWFGSKLAKKAVKKIVKSTPLVDMAVSAASKALSYTPYGVVANAALGAMKTALEGGNLKDIAEGAARGAIPDEIEAAVNVARDVVRGKNVVKSVLGNAAKAFIPGTPESEAFGAASKILTSGGGLTALAGARRMLDTEGARRAFDSAVGLAAKTAKKQGTKFAKQAISGATKKAAKVASKVTHKPLTARAAGVVSQAFRNASVASLVGRRETAGLEQGALIYIVENGDSPWKIAKTLMGDGNLWPQLVAANPGKATVKTGANKGGFTTLFKGERLKLPSSWTAKLAKTVTGDAVMQARAVLATWSDSDGSDESGVQDYGDRAEDKLEAWSARDAFMLTSFLNWSNRSRGTSYPVSGELTDGSAEALRSWVAQHAAQPVTPTTPPEVPSAPVTPVTPVTPSAPVVVPPVTDTIYGGDPITWSPMPDTTSAEAPDDIRALYQAARASGNAAQMRTVAAQIRTRVNTAYGAQAKSMADDLDAVAASLTKSAVTPPAGAAATGQAPTPQATTQPGPAASATGEDNTGLLLAAGLILAKVAHLF